MSSLRTMLAQQKEDVHAAALSSEAYLRSGRQPRRREVSSAPHRPEMVSPPPMLPSIIPQPTAVPPSAVPRPRTASTAPHPPPRPPPSQVTVSPARPHEASNQINIISDASPSATALTMVLEAARNVVDSYELLRVALSPEESNALLQFNESISSYLGARESPRTDRPLSSAEVLTKVSSSVGGTQSVGNYSQNRAIEMSPPAAYRHAEESSGPDCLSLMTSLTRISFDQPMAFADFSHALQHHFRGWHFAFLQFVDEDLLLRLDEDENQYLSAKLDDGLAQVVRRCETFSTDGRIVVPITHGANLIGVIDANVLEEEYAISAASLQHNSSFSLSIAFAAQLLTAQMQVKELRTQVAESQELVAVGKELTRDVLDKRHLAETVVKTIAHLCEADRCSLFLRDDKDAESLCTYDEDSNAAIRVPIGKGIAGGTFSSGQVQNIADAYSHKQFLASVDKQTGYRTISVLSTPIIDENSVVAVAQLLNKRPVPLVTGGTTHRVFTDRDVGLIKAASPMIALCLKICDTATALETQKQRIDNMYRSIEVGAQTNLNDGPAFFTGIRNGAKQLLQTADIYVFVVDAERREVRYYFDGGQIPPTTPVSGGLVGHVVKESWSRQPPPPTCWLTTDPMFDQEIDAPNTPDVIQVVTAPLVADDVLIGVINFALNTSEEVSQPSLQQIADFSKMAAVWLRNFNLFDFTVRVGRAATKLSSSMSRNKRLTSRGRAKSINEAARDAVLATELDDVITETMTTPEFNIFKVRRNLTVSPLDVCTKILIELFATSGLLPVMKCSQACMSSFLIAVREQYRAVPYHNFFHAVDVTQTVYTYLYHGKAAERLTQLECFVLLVACTVHDIDHMGLNNSFHLKADTPLGILSSASGNNSVLEVHHCNLAIDILQIPHLNVFGGLNQDDEAEAYRLMVDCILATDMSRHKELLSAVDAACPFDDKNSDHRKYAMQMLLKSADISNVTKPFPISEQWGMLVTEEFFSQGDLEKNLGVDVLPMMDRAKNSDLAKSQLGFINFVAKAFFETMVQQLFPSMSWTLDNLEKNITMWDAYQQQ